MTHRRAALFGAAAACALVVAVSMPGVPALADGPTQACTTAGWVRVSGVGTGVTSIAGSRDFEFMFAGSFAGSTNHLWRGTADDATWLGVPDLSSVLVTSVALGPGVDPPVWVSERGGGVYASDTGGSTFRFSGLTDHSVTALAPITSTVLAAASRGTRSGIYGWDAGSGTWLLRGGDQIASPIFYALVPDARDSLWLGTEVTGLWTSDDAGRTWRSVSLSGTSSSTVISLATDPRDPQRLFAGQGRPRVGLPGLQDPKGIQVSENGGASWINRLTDVTDVTGVAALASESGSVYATGWGRGLFHSSDGGRSWQSVPGPASAEFPQAYAHLEALAAVSPRGAGGCELLLAGGSDGLWARDVAGVDYHRIFIPTAACQSAHCTAQAAQSPDREPLRRQLADDAASGPRSLVDDAAAGPRSLADDAAAGPRSLADDAAAGPRSPDPRSGPPPE